MLSDFDFTYEKVLKLATMVRMKQDKNVRKKNSKMKKSNLPDRSLK